MDTNNQTDQSVIEANKSSMEVYQLEFLSKFLKNDQNQMFQLAERDWKVLKMKIFFIKKLH